LPSRKSERPHFAASDEASCISRWSTSTVTRSQTDPRNDAIVNPRRSDRPTLAGVMALLLLAVVVMGLGALTTVLVSMYR
jgi:hypothetical protein